MPEPPELQLHPAEHRAYRELYASSRQLVRRWGRLIGALDGTAHRGVLVDGRERVDALLTSLAATTPRYDLHGGVAAQGLGARIGDLRGAVTDRTIDTGMVMRLAALDVTHIAILLGHLAELAEARGDAELASWDREWEAAIRKQAKATRKAAIALGGDPELAAAPIDSSPVGRAAHRVGWVFGSVGEAIDRVAGTRSPERSP